MSSPEIYTEVRIAASWSLSITLAVIPLSASAYIGPGAGLSVIGSLLAFFAAIIVAILGFLFFPIRRLLRRRKQKIARKSPEASPNTADGTAPSAEEQPLNPKRTGNPEQ